MKQLNHFDNYGFVLPKITQWYHRYTDQYGRVDMGLHWDPMGSLVLEYGFCKSTTNAMPGLSDRYDNYLNVAYGATYNTSNPLGGFPSNIYYVRAYVRNVVGIVWSDVVVVNTRDNRVYAPTVTTNAVSGIYSTRGFGGGNVTSDGGAAVSERGLCWNSNSGVSPTTSNDRTIEGSGTGSFTSHIRSLTPNTTYYVRAYAINSVGTAYGSVVSFQTSVAGVPMAIIYDLTDITATSTLAYGRIYDNGGSAITQKGFVWNTTGNPSKENGNTVLADGTGDADFNKAITGLPSGTRIYAKAFGVNSYGTGYGDQTTYTTAGVVATIRELILQFDTNCPPTEAFVPYIVPISGSYEWDLGDGTIVAGNAVAHLYANSNTKTVKLYCISGTPTISNIVIRFQFVIGIMDVSHSAFASLVRLQIENNKQMTGIALPAVITGAVERFDLSFNGIVGLLNLRALVNFSNSASILLNDNPITLVYFENTVSGLINYIDMRLCNLTDLQGFAWLQRWTTAASLHLSNNPNLTDVNFATNPHLGFIKALDISYCSLKRFSFSGWATAMQVPNLGYDFISNGMTAGQVNKLLWELNFVAPQGGSGNIIITGTNAAPDATSDNLNGLAYKASLISKGFTVSTN